MFWLIFACHYIRKRLPHKLQQQTKSSLPPGHTVAYKAQLRRMVDWSGGGGEWKACDHEPLATPLAQIYVCML